MKSSASKIRINGFNDLFGATANKEGVTELPISKLYAFTEHPFQVLDDEKMEDLVESIKENGVLTPILVRPRENSGYEIISGHRRSHAAIKAKLETVPAVIKDLSDDEATVLMVDANIQREEILPSEKAFAFKMKMEAMSHQGSSDGAGKLSCDAVGESSGVSGRQVQRYIRLTYLNKDLMEMVDGKKISMGVGYTVSYLNEEQQNWLVDCLLKNRSKINDKKAVQLKSESECGWLTLQRIQDILRGQIEKPIPKRVQFSSVDLNQFFPEEYTGKQCEEIIYQLLNEWKAKGGGTSE